MKPVCLFFLILLPFMLEAADFVVDREERSFPAEQRTKLLIHNADGRTEVRGESGTREIQVLVEKEVVGVRNEDEANREADKVTVKFYESAGSVEIKARDDRRSWGLSFGSTPRVTVRITVTTPSETDLDLHGADGVMDVRALNGKITVDGADGELRAADLTGSIRLTVADGEMQVTNAQGELQFSVADGDLEAQSCSGNLAVGSADGDIRITAFNGAFQGRTADGNLYVDGVLTAVNARAADGEVRLRAAEGSSMQENWSLSAADGNLTLGLPQEFSADLQLETSDGRIVTEIPLSVSGRISRNRLSGKINNGGKMLKIHTGDGDITLTSNGSSFTESFRR